MSKQSKKEPSAAAFGQQRGMSIKQTAHTYGITIDTLYYYERIGLVVPMRNPVNGYRIYRGDDFFRLNIITELTSMGFSLAQIGEYLSEHSFFSTIELMNEELALIDTEIEQLKEKKESVFESMRNYVNAMAEARLEKISIGHVEKRECLLVSKDVLQYDVVPHAFAECARKHGVKLNALHTTPCYMIDTSRFIEPLGCYEPLAILLYSDALPCKSDFTLEAGTYATCTFQGSFRETERQYKRIKSFIAQHGYKEEPGALEFCLIGEYESNDKNEYITRLEIPVSPL